MNGAAVYGVTVNAQGKATSELHLIRSSGYGIFNQQAIQDISSYTFPVGGGSYYATVSYRYNPKACPNIPSSPQAPTLQEVNDPPTQQTPVLIPQNQSPGSPDLPTATGNQSPSTPTIPETPGNPPTVGQPSEDRLQTEYIITQPTHTETSQPSTNDWPLYYLKLVTNNQTHLNKIRFRLILKQLPRKNSQQSIPQQPKPSVTPSLPAATGNKPPVSQPNPAPTSGGTKPATPEATQVKPTPEATQPKPATPTPVKPRTTQGSPASIPSPRKNPNS